jgi:thiol:disulfide interchange protein DsbD
MNLGTLRRLNAKLTVIIAFCVLSNAFGQSPGQPQHAKISLISERSSLVPEHADWIGIRFDLDPGWHIYWTNPGDSGEPPKVTWQLPAGFKVGDLQFPVPKRIFDHSLTDYGYEGSVVLLAKLTTSGATSSKASEIAADVRYLVCREVCVPAKDHVSLNLESGNSSQAALAIEAAKKRLPQKPPRGAHISARAEGDTFVVTIGTRGGSSSRMGLIMDFIPAEERLVENAAKPLITPALDAQEITLKKSEQLNHPVTELRGLLITSDRAYNIVVPVTSGKPNTHAGAKKS